MINEPTIKSQPYLIFSLLLSKYMNTLAALAVTIKSTAAEDTAGVLVQSAIKSLPIFIDIKLKYHVPNNPIIERKR